MRSWIYKLMGVLFVALPASAQEEKIQALQFEYKTVCVAAPNPQTNINRVFMMPRKVASYQTIEGKTNFQTGYIADAEAGLLYEINGISSGLKGLSKGMRGPNSAVSDSVIKKEVKYYYEDKTAGSKSINSYRVTRWIETESEATNSPVVAEYWLYKNSELAKAVKENLNSDMGMHTRFALPKVPQKLSDDYIPIQALYYMSGKPFIFGEFTTISLTAPSEEMFKPAKGVAIIMQPGFDPSNPTQAPPANLYETSGGVYGLPPPLTRPTSSIPPKKTIDK